MVFMNRRIYFIKKDFQSRFILRFVGIATLWAIATVTLFSIYAEQRIEEIRYSSHIAVTTTAELLMPSILNAQGIALFVFAGLVAYTVASLWKRLAAPLAQIKRDIRNIALGDLVNPVAVRSGEEFPDLAADIDRMRNDLRRKVNLVKDRQKELMDAAKAVAKSVYKNSPSKTEAAALKTALDRMKEALHAFRY